MFETVAIMLNGYFTEGNHESLVKQDIISG